MAVGVAAAAAVVAVALAVAAAAVAAAGIVVVVLVLPALPLYHLLHPLLLSILLIPFIAVAGYSKELEVRTQGLFEGKCAGIDKTMYARLKVVRSHWPGFELFPCKPSYAFKSRGPVDKT